MVSHSVIKVDRAESVKLGLIPIADYIKQNKWRVSYPCVRSHALNNGIEPYRVTGLGTTVYYPKASLDKLVKPAIDELMWKKRLKQGISARDWKKRIPPGFFSARQESAKLEGLLSDAQLNKLTKKFIEVVKEEEYTDLPLPRKGAGVQRVLTDTGWMALYRKAIKVGGPFTEKYQQALRIHQKDTGGPGGLPTGGFLESSVLYTPLALSFMTDGICHPQYAGMLFSKGSNGHMAGKDLLRAMSDRAVHYREDQSRFNNFTVGYFHLTNEVPRSIKEDRQRLEDAVKDCMKIHDYKLFSEAIQDLALRCETDYRIILKGINRMILTEEKVRESITNVSIHGKEYTVVYSRWFKDRTTGITVRERIVRLGSRDGLNPSMMYDIRDDEVHLDEFMFHQGEY